MQNSVQNSVQNNAQDGAHPVTIAFDALPAMVGQELAVSDWFAVGQDRIDAFAAATDDRQWIHLDPERCRRESPFGVPVAHGFLTLSLLPAMLGSALAIDGVRVGINYGLNKVRFPSALPAGSRVRARWTLCAAEVLAGEPANAAARGWHLTWEVTVEPEAGARPVCVAEYLFRVYE